MDSHGVGPLPPWCCALSRSVVRAAGTSRDRVISHRRAGRAAADMAMCLASNCDTMVSLAAGTPWTRAPARPIDRAGRRARTAGAWASRRGRGRARRGDPGIGKTRFLAEVVAHPAGLRPFLADADELERARPFGPLADALGCRLASPDQLCAEIARLIDDGAAEFRIAEPFAELLERMALEGPLLVVIDDLQWATSPPWPPCASPAATSTTSRSRSCSRPGPSREATSSRASSTPRSATVPCT
jgi:AAA ATPase domain